MVFMSSSLSLGQVLVKKAQLHEDQSSADVGNALIRTLSQQGERGRERIRASFHRLRGSL